MKPVFIHYSVDEEELPKYVEYIRRYFQQLDEHLIAGIHHAVYKIGSATFLHICYYPTCESSEAATALPAFRQVVKKLESIIAQEPIVNDVVEIGRYCG